MVDNVHTVVALNFMVNDQFSPRQFVCFNVSNILRFHDDYNELGNVSINYLLPDAMHLFITPIFTFNT